MYLVTTHNRVRKMYIYIKRAALHFSLTTLPLLFMWLAATIVNVKEQKRFLCWHFTHQHILQTCLCSLGVCSVIPPPLWYESQLFILTHPKQDPGDTCRGVGVDQECRLPICDTAEMNVSVTAFHSALIKPTASLISSGVVTVIVRHYGS